LLEDSRLQSLMNSVQLERKGLDNKNVQKVKEIKNMILYLN
jgi:hypothetical protein